jgi:hypothetical protein
MLEWGEGRRDTGDAAADKLEVYMNYQGLDENHEEKYGKLKVSRTPKLTALARIMQLLDIPIIKVECIVRDMIDSSLENSMVRGKLLGVCYARSTVVNGPHEGPAKAPQVWIGLEEATMRLFTVDSESADFLSDNTPFPSLCVGAGLASWKISITTEVIRTKHAADYQSLHDLQLRAYVKDALNVVGSFRPARLLYQLEAELKLKSILRFQGSSLKLQPSWERCWPRMWEGSRTGYSRPAYRRINSLGLC